MFNFFLLNVDLYHLHSGGNSKRIHTNTMYYVLNKSLLTLGLHEIENQCLTMGVKSCSTVQWDNWTRTVAWIFKNIMVLPGMWVALKYGKSSISQLRDISFLSCSYGLDKCHFWCAKKKEVAELIVWTILLMTSNNSIPLISKSLNVNICSTVCKHPVAAKGNMSALWQAGYALEKNKSKISNLCYLCFSCSCLFC